MMLKPCRILHLALLLFAGCLVMSVLPAAAHAATLSFTLTTSEPVVVTGTPRLAIDVGGTTRYATYASGSGTAALTFSYAIQPGDFDANGITLASPLDLNGGSIADIAGNSVSPLAFSLPDTSALNIQTYTASFTTSPINSANANAVDFAIAKAPTGANFTYSITSSDGVGSVTGSGTISGSAHTVSNVDVSSLAAGTLSLSVAVSTSAGGTGSARTASATPVLAGALDSLSSAAALFSLRRLKGTYAGPLVRVRRASDNTERDIAATIAGDLDTTTLTSFCGASSCYASVWYDQSGSARNAAQATAASQPRIVNAGIVDTAGGRPTLTWPSPLNSVMLRTTASFVVGAVSVVTQYDNGSRSAWLATYQGVFGGAGAAPAFMVGNIQGQSVFYSGNGPVFDQWARNGGGLAAAAGAPALPWPLATAYATASASQNYTWSFGSDRALSGRGWTGPMSEFLMFPAALSASDRQTMERDQGSYFGIAVP